MEIINEPLGTVRPYVEQDNWSIDKGYNFLTIVYDPSSNKSYISRKDVPANVVIDNREYWIPFGVGRFVDNAIININYLDGVSQKLVTYTLEEAIVRIGDEDKRLGMIISFYGNEANDTHTPGWCLYQFTSSDLNDWNNVNAWNSIYYNRNKNVGWFRNESELLAIYPSPYKGDYCYIGVSLISSFVYRCYENGTWVNTHEPASANIGISIGGNIRISENGTWIVDDEDTGIKAVGTGIEKMIYIPSQEDGGTNILQIKLTDSRQFNFSIKNGNKGDQGNSGIIVPDLETFLAELVNNLTTDDATKGLSAAQGVVLDNKISQLGQNIIELLSNGYLFRGIAIPTTNPGTVIGKVFYLAATVGTYEHFNNAVVANNEIRVFMWNGSSWISSLTGLAGIRDVNGIKNVAQFLSCNTAGDVAAKEITQNEYLPLYNGFFKVIHFNYTNTANDVTLSINGETGKPLILNTVRVSSINPVIGGVDYLLTWRGGANYYITEFNNNFFEKNINKVISLSANSTDEQYPSAKCVYNTFQIANVSNKIIIDNGRINADGTLNIQSSSTFRILGLIDLSVLNPGQTLFYKGITITETSSHVQLYYRYLSLDGETVVGVGQLKTEEQITIPNNAKYLQFGISVNDVEGFKVNISYVFQNNLKDADKSLRFAVFSDLHCIGNDDATKVQELYNAIVDETIASHLDFVIFNGDMVDGYSGHDPDVEYAYLYENLISKIKCPIFFTVGNHDGVTNIKTLEQYYLQNDQRSMETDMFYFIFLNAYYLGNRDPGGLKKWTYDGVDTTFAQAELTKAAILNKIPIIVIHELGDYSSDSVIEGLLEDFEQKIVIYSHTHNTDNAQRTGNKGFYINPGCFLNGNNPKKTYALLEMTTTAFKSTIVDLTNNTRTPVNVFSTIKDVSANIVLYKNKD